MMKSYTHATAFFFLLNGVAAHLRMQSPKPFGDATKTTAPNNPAPLGAGVVFPCQLGPSGQYDFSSATSIAAGSSTLVKWLGASVSEGIAVHGGGSCQFSLSTTPSTNQKDWKVIKTIIGGCPATTVGNLPYVDCSGPGTNETDCLKQYNVEIPKDVPSGQYFFAWTWFNRIGNREMYMNCAPIKVTGGGSDPGYMDTLPALFMANTDGLCTTKEQIALPIPNPGQNVEVSNNVLDKSTPEGLGTCVSVYGDAAKAPNAPVKGSGGTISLPAEYYAFTNPPKAGGYAASAPAASNGNNPPQAGTPAVVPVASSSAPTGQFAESPTATSMVTFYTTSSAGAGAGAAPSQPAQPAMSAAAPPSAAPPSSNTGACPAGRTACPAGSADGALVCLPSSQFAICDRGCMQPQALAAGTVCNNGQIQRLARGVRF